MLTETEIKHRIKSKIYRRESMFIVKLFYFLLLSIASDRCLKWVWKAVYRSAYIREEDVERYRELTAFSRRRDNTTGWVIDSSPNPLKTLSLVFLFYAGLLPAIAGQFLVPLSLLVPSTEKVVDIFAVAVPVLCVIYLIAGIIYNKVAKEPDYDKFSKKHITNYESRNLANYAEDWETGKYKSKSRFVPSKLPQYLIIIAMVGGFVSLPIIASLNGGRIELSFGDDQTTAYVTEIPSTTANNDPLIAEMKKYRDTLEEQGFSVSNYKNLNETFDYLIGWFDANGYSNGKDMSIVIYLYDTAENALTYTKRDFEDEIYTHYTSGNCEVFIYKLVHRYIISICRGYYVAEINCGDDSLPELNELLKTIDFCEIKEGH